MEKFVFSPQQEQAIAAYPQIDFRRIVSHQGRWPIHLRGASQAELKATYLPKQILEIRDADESDFLYLIAEIDRSVPTRLWFALATKKLHPSERHPDFFAAKFIDIAFSLFPEVETISSLWDSYSDNYQTFMQLISEGSEWPTAVLQTWSGKQFTRHGFNQVMSCNFDADGNVETIFARG